MRQDGATIEEAEGLACDLRAMLTRRRALAGLAAGGIGFLGGLRQVGAATGKAADGSVCIADAVETAGPFPADGSGAGGGLNALAVEGVGRSDIRGNFGGLKGQAAGLPVALELTLVDVGKACAPLAGYAVYLWHCDAAGRYSLYDVPDANYLRGVVVSDAGGVVRVTTVFPGCYRGRWPHIHFEVFTSVAAAVKGEAAVLTSQLALPEAVCASVYGSTAGYEASKGNFAGQTLAGDMVFADNTADEMTAMTLVVKRDPLAGTSARAVIGVVG